MNDQKRFSPEEIEPLVRSYLAQRAAVTDPTAAIDRFRSAVRACEEPSTRPMVAHTRPRIRVARWALAAAALIAMVFGLFMDWPTGGRRAYASADQLLRDVHKIMNTQVDRCYLVEVFRSTVSSAEESAVADGRVGKDLSPIVNRLWFRGDCFLVRQLSPDRRWVYGRDQQGRIWLCDGQHTGVQFEADELPPALTEEPPFSGDVIGIPLRKLLAEFLSDFTIRYPEDLPPSLDAETVTVRVDAKHLNVHEQLQGATLEIDPRTKLIRRLTLDRKKIKSRVYSYTLTLLDGESLAEEDYQVESHLQQPYQVYTDRNQPERRAEWIERWRVPSLRSCSPGQPAAANAIESEQTN